MDKDLERLIKYIRKEDVALFIGSGFSFKAGAPHVCDIIEEILNLEGYWCYILSLRSRALRLAAFASISLCFCISHSM